MNPSYWSEKDGEQKLSYTSSTCLINEEMFEETRL